MGIAAKLGAGAVGGAATMMARAATRRMMHDRAGRPKLPARARMRRGLAMTITWSLVAGVVLAIADVLREQRAETMPDA